jgi:hypothetical protein
VVHPGLAVAGEEDDRRPMSQSGEDPEQDHTQVGVELDELEPGRSGS